MRANKYKRILQIMVAKLRNAYLCELTFVEGCTLLPAKARIVRRLALKNKGFWDV